MNNRKKYGDYIGENDFSVENDLDDSYLDSMDDLDEDISLLEDDLDDDIEERSVIMDEDFAALALNIPIYRLRLVYSKETFHAAWAGELLEPGVKVLVPTRYGRDLAEIIGVIQKKNNETPHVVTRIERLATEEDISRSEYHNQQEREAFVICKEKISAHKLEMKLVSVHYLLEEPKVLFFFTAESRVDFRDLVKDLVSIFKARIELRQIGVRDESRVVGGLGVCGRCYCCHSISDKLKPVSIKMAKDQNLSLNSMKISGPCGRLLCCLAYEHLFYGEQKRILPPEGCRVIWNGSNWRVIEVNVVMNKVRISHEDGRVQQLPADLFEKTEGRCWTIKEK